MSKKTKALVSSFVAIAMSASLAIGGTYALFTSEDKVNVAVTSGKVAVTASVSDFAYSTLTQDWTAATQNGEVYETTFDNIGGSATLNGKKITLDKIVPGDAVKFNVDITNESTVDVKYRVVIANDTTKETGLFAGLEVTVDGSEFKGETIGAWTELAPTVTEVDSIPVMIELPEDATNDYQGKSCEINVIVEAVQGNAEVKNPVNVSAANSFAEIATLIADGEDLYVSESINLTDSAPGNTYLTVNEDVAIYAAKDAVISFNETALINGSGSITVYGGTLKTNYELCVTGDATLVVEGGEHSFGAFSATGNGKIVVNGGTLNCRGTYAGVMGISFAENGSLIVNDGKLNMYQPFNLNANRCDAAYIEINGGTIDLLNGIENLFVVRNIMDKDGVSGVLRGSSVRVNGGTFIAHYEIDSAGDATSFLRNGDHPADMNKVLVSNAKDSYDCVVKGGTFYGSWQRADNQRYTNGNGGYSDGLFVENSIAGFVASGYEIVGDAVNGYVVSAN